MPKGNQHIKSAANLYERRKEQAEYYKVIGQMIVGLLTAIGVVVAIVIGSVHPAINPGTSSEKVTAEVFAVTAAGRRPPPRWNWRTHYYSWAG